MPKTFNASAGYSFNNDYGYFDGPDPDLVDLVGNDIGSLEGFGIGEFTVYVETPAPILTQETFGAPEATQQLQVQGSVNSAETFGNLEFALYLSFTGIVSGEVFTGPLLQINLQDVGKIGSAENVPGPSLSIYLTSPGIGSMEKVIGGEVYLQWAKKFAKISPLWSKDLNITSNWAKQSPANGGFK